MQEPIYFSKVEFRKNLGIKEYSIILLNLPERELSFQAFKLKLRPRIVIGQKSEELFRHTLTFDIEYPIQLIASERTGFKPETLRTDEHEYELIYSYGIRLNDQQYEDLLPLCNALDFEPYRGRKMVMGEKGYIGYRDEIQVHFRAITDSHLPIIELPMDYFYDEAHTWPSEKLYCHIIDNIFGKIKKMRHWR